MAAKTITLKIAQNEYTVKFPKTGEQMDIDLMKLQLSDNKYETLRYSFHPSFAKNANRIDAVATFNVLIPDLKKDLNVKSLFLLEEDQFQVVMDTYEEQFLPWYEEWIATLNKPKEESK